MVRHRAVGSVAQPPIAQTRLGLIGTRVRIAGREEPIQHQALHLVARQGGGPCSGHQAGTASRQRHGEALLRRTLVRERLLFQVTA